MPIVNGYTTDKVDELIADNVVSGTIDSDTGELTLTTVNGTIISVGSIVTGISDGTTDAKGIVELATDVETQAGTDSTRAVTPLGLASVVATTSAKGIVELATDAEVIAGTDTTRAVTPHGAAATFQPIDSDLTAIAGLSKANGDFLQATSGVWANRTTAQVATSLGGVGLPQVSLYSGSAYALVSGPAVYVGPVDPGSVANGSVWFDTTGA